MLAPAATAPVLRIEMKKIGPARSSLAVRRPDGSTTWSRVHPFFPLHDLTHFAVETTLGIRRGFYGLLAAGWSLEDFTRPGVAARLPEEAHRTEVIVGTFDGLGAAPTFAEFSTSLAAAFAGQGLPADFTIPPADFAAICRARIELGEHWTALPVGDTLRLEFAVT